MKILPKNFERIFLPETSREESLRKLGPIILDENLGNYFPRNPRILVQNWRGNVCRKFCIAPPCKL